ncbi:MAG: YeeE/YedE family protein [Ardenticatenaceae bacterium]|nr:YeeE/YedE family protein [Anaerolineales bacterium]MCB8917852.1 YeeE/YedE family protein [Ardenticatenaceae bacterium]
MSVISADTREQIEERERRPNWLVAQLRKPEWSPYAAGIMLGIVFAFSLLVAGQMPGSSGAFESLIAYLGSRIFPQNIYFRFVMPPGITWQVWLLLGTFLGAFVSAWISHDFRWRTVPDKQWVSVFGTARWKRWLIAFGGGVLLEIAAGIAGGCTSGLAIAGGVQLAPAAFLFIPGMLISGILTALIIYRKNF